jgi:hypothetical protein
MGLMAKGVPQFRKNKKILKIVDPKESKELPVQSNKLNIWDWEFGYILKDGRPTTSTKAYWQNMRRKLKQ